MKSNKSIKRKPSSNPGKSKLKSKPKKAANGTSSPLDAIELLKSQHREVEALFVELKSETSLSAKTAVFKKIADKLSMHITIEETHFYPAVRDKRTEDILLESLEEHLGIKRVIADLLRLRPENAKTFDAKIEVLREQVEHHVEEEEHDLFPKVKRIFNRSDMAAIAEAMQKKHRKMVGTNPRKRVIAETNAAAPL